MARAATHTAVTPATTQCAEAAFEYGRRNLLDSKSRSRRRWSMALRLPRIQSSSPHLGWEWMVAPVGSAEAEEWTVAMRVAWTAAMKVAWLVAMMEG